MTATIIGIVVAVVVGLGAMFITKEKDGSIEEAAEYYIEKETGLDIDLSPWTPESEDAPKPD